MTLVDHKDIFLTICVPTYNRPELLKRALNSIPDYYSVEVVVTDNSSDNRSELVVKRHFENAKCKWQYNRNNFPTTWSGSKLMVENFNMGLKLAKGSYIMYVHDDDFLWEGGLDYVIDYIQKFNFSVFQFAVNLVNYEGKKLKTQGVSSEIYLNSERAVTLLLSNSSVIRFPAIVFHRDVVKDVGYFDPSCKGPTDLDMWARMFAKFGVFRASKVISAYTIHDGAQTMKTFNESNIKILLEIFDNVSSWNIINESDFINAKSKFFHQFILAGTFRLLKRGEVNEARKVMHLFKIPQMKELNVPVYWLPLRLLFSAILFIPALPLKLKISLN